MILITVEQLRTISPNAHEDILEGIVPYLNKYLDQYQVNTELRLIHFLGQTAEESAGYRTLVEYGNGEEYEGRRDLGNIMRGDGPRYKGRGMIQLTGRSNYRTYGNILHYPLEQNPELAATPEVAVQTALEYWKQRNLNFYADRDDINDITRKINGGLNGLQSRQAFTDRADNIFKPLFPS
jgi:putative chitinase